MSNIFNFFVVLLTVQLFYSLGITLLVYTTEPMSVDNTILEQYTNSTSDMEDVTGELEGAIGEQTDIPLVDIAGLVFYSGNIILDLMLNFYFALPSMVTLLVAGFDYVFLLDPIVAANVKLFLYGLVAIFYTMSLLSFILSIRSGIKVT